MTPRLRATVATSCLAGAVVLYSLVPLVIRATGENRSAWAFAASMESSSTIVLLFVLAVSAPRLFSQDGGLRAVLRPARLVLFPPATRGGPNPRTTALLLAMVAPNMVLYLLAMKFAPLVVVVCLTDGLGFASTALLIARWSSTTRMISRSSAILMCCLPVGAVAVIWSQSSTDTLGVPSPRSIPVGVALALVTGVTFSLRPALGLLYGDRSEQARHGAAVAQPLSLARTLWWTTLGTKLVSLPVMILAAVLAAMGGSGVIRSSVMGIAAGCILAVCQFLIRVSIVTTVDTRIMSLMYALPLLSALWLWRAGDPIHRVPLFVFGAGVIVLLNVAIGANRSRAHPA